MDLLRLCQENDIGLDVFRDQAGTRGLAVAVRDQFFFLIDDGSGTFQNVVEQIFWTLSPKAIYDIRKLDQFGVDLRSLSEIYDVKVMYGGEETIFGLAKKNLDDETHRELLDLDQRYLSHVRSAKTVGIDLEEHSMLKLIPGKFMQKMLKLRCHVALRLLQLSMKNRDTGFESWCSGGRRFVLALHEVEKNRIRIDLDLVERQLKRSDLPVHVRQYFVNLEHLETGGFVQTRFNPNGSRTGRIKVDSSDGRVFNCMGIPKGLAREAIISRFEGGEIVSVDLNAVDYRCIVASVDDREWKRRYEHAQDFHSINCGLIGDGNKVTPEIRKAVKELTYISIYGGSPETAAEKSGLTLKNVRRVMEIFDQQLRPVHEFRRCLFEKSQSVGYVELPNGRRILIERDDHAGKVLGLYGQGYSSLRFERAYVRIVDMLRGRRSKIIFTVHDEVVLDVHPDEPYVPTIVQKELERAEFGWPLVAEISKGKNYREATE